MGNAERVILLDGATGTELDRRGADVRLPLWSARAIFGDPQMLAAVHADYFEAGADLITTNTFRTRPAVFGDRWRELVSRAVRAARESVPDDHRIAGSIAPLCHRGLREYPFLGGQERSAVVLSARGICGLPRVPRGLRSVVCSLG